MNPVELSTMLPRIPAPTGAPSSDAVRGAAAGASTDSAGGAEGGASFSDALLNALDDVDADLKAADSKVNAVVRGEKVELHELMMSLEKADVSARMMTQVGRRALDAYREVMRMNV